MKKSTKLNVLLAKTDHLASNFAGMLKDYIKFFKNSQGAFMGEKRTYAPKEGTIDEPSKRKNTQVQTTVNEKFDWFKENSTEYIDSLFSVEATNASGLAKAELVVGGESWGELTSLELLRLKSLLENNDFKSMLEIIPVRSDSLIWTKSTNEMYQERDVYETPLQEGVEKTTEVTSYVLEDPNIGKLKDASGYTPQIATKKTVMELGDYTYQMFTGTATQREKADILKKRTVLLTAVIEALKTCNEVEVQPSNLTSEKILGYLVGK